MSRPQKIHKPIKGAFNNILAAVAMGSGKGKRAATELQTRSANIVKASTPTPDVRGKK
jgi:hypothetical protein